MTKWKEFENILRKYGFQWTVINEIKIPQEELFSEMWEMVFSTGGEEKEKEIHKMFQFLFEKFGYLTLMDSTYLRKNFEEKEAVGWMFEIFSFFYGSNKKRLVAQFKNAEHIVDVGRKKAEEESLYFEKEIKGYRLRKIFNEEEVKAEALNLFLDRILEVQTELARKNYFKDLLQDLSEFFSISSFEEKKER